METPRYTKTEEKYQDFKKQHKDNPEALELFDFKQETIIRDFTHWMIIKNRFPYDRMARINHMLVSKQPLRTQYDASTEARNELITIMKLLEKEAYYDAYLENFPKTKSVKQHVHIHLICWHNTQQ